MSAKNAESSKPFVVRALAWAGWILLPIVVAAFVYYIRMNGLQRGAEAPVEEDAAAAQTEPEPKFAPPSQLETPSKSLGGSQRPSSGAYGSSGYGQANKPGTYNSGYQQQNTYQAPQYQSTQRAWRSPPPKTPSGVPPRDPYLYGDAGYALQAVSRYVASWVRDCPFPDVKRTLPKKLRDLAAKRPDLEESLRSIAVELGRAKTFEALLGDGLMGFPLEREMSVNGTAMKVKPMGFADPILLCDCSDGNGRTAKNYRLSLDKMTDSEKLAVVSSIPVTREPAVLASRAFLLLKRAEPEDFRDFVRKYGLTAFEPIVKVVAPDADGAAAR